MSTAASHISPLRNAPHAGRKAERRNAVRRKDGDRFWRLTPSLQGTSSHLVTVMNAEGVVRYVSPPFRALLGVALPSEGIPLQTLLRPCSKETAKGAIARMSSGERFALWRLCFEGLAGRQHHWLEGRAANFLDDPRLAGIVTYWRDMMA